MPNGLFQQPQDSMPKIKEIWAFVSMDPKDGNEGVCAVSFGGTVMPMIASDGTRVKELMPYAQGLAESTGIKIKLIKFSAREEICDVEAIGSGMN